MDQTLINFLFYSLTAIICTAVISVYLIKRKRQSRITDEKILNAMKNGLHEPVSLYPYVDPSSCIGTGACVAACPEKDILGMKNGRAVIINASRCIGHGACFLACPTEAISLRMGTSKRGVDIPHINKTFESNVPGIYIAGELGGMGLIRNATEQGKQAVENIVKSLRKNHGAEFDLIIVGAGPAGVSASLAAKKNDLKFLLLEQDYLGGTVLTYPRHKIIMTSPFNLPLYGKFRFLETKKEVLLGLWKELILKYGIPIKENCKAELISRVNDLFNVSTSCNEDFSTAHVLLTIGRRGTPRKLNVPGENSEKVAYSLMEPEDINAKKILIVGGGDTAIEAALLLADNNIVTVSYRSDAFGRIKPGNMKAIENAMESGRIIVMFKTNLKKIDEEEVTISTDSGEIKIDNDLVFIFAGGELPTQFLEKAGVNMTRMTGQAFLEH